MKKLLILMVLLVVPPVFAAGEDLVGMDIPTGTEAGVVQQLDLAKGKVMISGRQLDLSPQALDSLFEARKRFGNLLGKVVVFKLDEDGPRKVVRGIFVQEAVR